MELQTSFIITNEFEKMTKALGAGKYDWVMTLEDDSALIGAFRVTKEIDFTEAMPKVNMAINRIQKKLPDAKILRSLGKKGVFLSIYL